MKKSCYCVICCLVVFGVAVFFLNGKIKTNHTLWDKMGISKDAISEVLFAYKGNAVSLTETSKHSLLETLSAGEEIILIDPYEYEKSMFDVIFEVDGKTYEVEFFWFTNLGIQRDGHSHQQPDDRFDVRYQNKVYHFRFANDRFWNDIFSVDAYDAAAKSQGKPTSYELDGYENKGMNGTGSYTYDKYSIWQVLTSSELIVKVKCEEANIDDPALSQVVQAFRIEKILRGQYEEDTLYIFSEIQNLNPDKISRHYHLPTDPPFVVGEEYVLCLNEWAMKLEWDNARHTLYKLPTQYHSAELNNGVLYSRYNTEYHPLKGVSVWWFTIMTNLCTLVELFQ